jgi:D-3-phosphoglycerate dehydrogenase
LVGSFAGQLTETAIEGITIEYAGDIAELNTQALSSAALAGVLRPLLSTVNVVSAPAMAKERGIALEETKRGQEGAYETYMRLTVTTERQKRSVAGTVFADGKPRLIQIKGINMEGEFGEHMLYVTNHDKPGFIGKLGSLLGAENINIATFNLGRAEKGNDAIALVQVDEPVSDEVLKKIEALENVVQAKRLSF